VIAWFFQVIGVVSFSLLLCYWLYQFGGVVVYVVVIAWLGCKPVAQSSFFIFFTYIYFLKILPSINQLAQSRIFLSQLAHLKKKFYHCPY
jgi:hypothetical protein